MADVTNTANEHFYISLQKAIYIIQKTSETQLKSIRKGQKVQKQAFIIYSLPGIGKSESLKSLAKTPDHIKIIDINAEFGGSLSMPIQSIHKSSQNEDEHEAEVLHAPHEDIKRLTIHARQHPDEVHYLFLDEFNRGDEFMKQTLMQLLLNNKVPGHDLPDNVFVVGAGNTSSNVFTDEAVDNEVNPIDVAGRDRIAPLFVQLDVKGWIDWAYQNDINEKIISFIDEDEEPEKVLYQAPSTVDGTGATPRSWSKLSNLLDIFQDEIQNQAFIRPLIASQVGNQLATRFSNYLLRSQNYSIKDLLTDPDTALEKFNNLPSSADRRSAIMNMPSYIEKHLESNNITDYKVKDNVFSSFVKISHTDDQQVLEKFIKYFFEAKDNNSNTIKDRHPLLTERINKSQRFANLKKMYSVSV